MFTAEEQAALVGPLDVVDPTKNDQSFTGTPATDAAAAAAGEYDPAVEAAARRKGWVPKEEWTRAEANWSEPLAFLEQHSTWTEERMEKVVSERMSGFINSVESKLGNVANRLDRVDTSDTAATDAKYTALMAEYAGDAESVRAIKKEWDEALATINPPTSAPPVNTQRTEAVNAFILKHPELEKPRTADEHADVSYAEAHLIELRKNNPQASEGDLMDQLSVDILRRRNPASAARGRTIDTGNGSGMSTNTPTDTAPDKGGLTAEERHGLEWALAEGGIYKDEAEGIAHITKSRATA